MRTNDGRMVLNSEPGGRLQLQARCLPNAHEGTVMVGAKERDELASCMLAHARPRNPRLGMPTIAHLAVLQTSFPFTTRPSQGLSAAGTNHRMGPKGCAPNSWTSSISDSHYGPIVLYHITSSRTKRGTSVLVSDTVVDAQPYTTRQEAL